MKKIAFWNNYTSFANNQAFNPQAYGIGENLGAPIILLKKRLEEEGFLLETLDMDDPNQYEKIIFSDVPNQKTCCVNLETIPKNKKYLILCECEMIYKPNSRKDLLNEYNKVFAYNDDLVEKYGYTKLCLPNKMSSPKKIPFNEKKFSTMIAGNKKIKAKGELYSERLKAINYMETKHIDEFDLYGFGWNLRTFTGIRPIRFLNRFNFLRKIFIQKHPSYKGKVEKKQDTLSKYKFCFCFENSVDIPGYISEKIWDCFFAGVVPIYLGAPNVLNYIPDNTFIDYRKFNSYDDLYLFLKNISEKEYNQYIENIEKFLLSKQASIFSAEYFADKIIKEIL